MKSITVGDQGLASQSYSIITSCNLDCPKNCIDMVIAVWGLKDGKVTDKVKAEAEAVRMSLVKAKEAGWGKIEIRGSCNHVLQKLMRRDANDLEAAVLLEDICAFGNLFDYCSFKLVSNLSTRISYKLAKFAIDLIHDVEWKVHFPSWITQNP